MSTGEPDAWERQRSLALTTVVWAAGSIGVGVVLAARRDRWWRAFGRQHVGWGVVDLGIVAIVQALQHRAMTRLSDPYDPQTLDRRRRHLRTILIANAVADAGYCAVGVIMVRRLRDPRAAGAGAAIVVQGAFLLLHDAYHAYGSRPAA